MKVQEKVLLTLTSIRAMVVRSADSDETIDKVVKDENSDEVSLPLGNVERIRLGGTGI